MRSHASPILDNMDRCSIINVDNLNYDLKSFLNSGFTNILVNFDKTVKKFFFYKFES